MKARIIFFIIVLVALMIVLPAFSYALREFIDVYKFSFSKIPHDYIQRILLKKETYLKFFTVSDPPNYLSWFIIGVYIVLQFLGSFGLLKLQSKYTQKDSYGSHGTSRWQIKSESKKYYYQDKTGWFIGSLMQGIAYHIGMEGAYHPISSKLNMQINVVGSPGSNKTTGFVLPAIFNIAYSSKDTVIKPDIIITDPKSELYTISSRYLQNIGYDIKVLDFIHLKYGDSFNFMDFINTEKELIEIADGYVRSVEAATGEGSKDGFWPEQEGQALGALIGAVQQTRPEDKRVMFEVLTMLTDDFANTDGSINMPKARKFFMDNITGAPLQLWKNFLVLSKSETTAGNIIGGLTGKLKLFAIGDIQKITKTTTIDISRLGAKKDRPMALYIFMSDSDRTFSPIINVILTSIFKQLYKTAYAYQNKLYNPVYFLIEEMANIGFISGLKEMLGTMRGRRIYPMMIWQSLSQMKDRYGDSWEELLSYCDTHVYLGINEEFTSKYVSNLLGNTTIRVQGVTNRKDGALSVHSPSESLNYQQRKLMLPDECSRMGDDRLIIWQRSRYPALLYKVQYKYWEDNKRICGLNDVFDLPLINSSNDINNDLPYLDVKIFSSREHQHEEERPEIDKIEHKYDKNHNITTNIKEPKSIHMHDLEGEFTIDSEKGNTIEKSGHNFDR